MAESVTQTTIRLPTELRERARAWSESHNRSLAWLVTRALEQYLRQTPRAVDGSEWCSALAVLEVAVPAGEAEELVAIALEVATSAAAQTGAEVSVVAGPYALGGPIGLV